MCSSMSAPDDMPVPGQPFHEAESDPLGIVSALSCRFTIRRQPPHIRYLEVQIGRPSGHVPATPQSFSETVRIGHPVE
jgi:hypothetical protein